MESFVYLFKTECLLQIRRSQQWLYPLGFFVIVLSLFPLALTTDKQLLQNLMPGCVWIAALLASLLSIGSFFSADLEDGHLEQLLMSEMPFSLIILAKLLAQWLLTQLPLILLLPLLSIFFYAEWQLLLLLGLTLLIGSPILICVGTFAVSLTLGLKHQGVLLGLLILPIVTPVLIFGVTIVREASAGFPVAGPLLFLAGLALLTITLLPLAIVTTLKISLE